MDEKSQKTEAPETPEAPPTGIPRNTLGAIMSRLSPQSLWTITFFSTLLFFLTFSGRGRPNANNLPQISYSFPEIEGYCSKAIPITESEFHLRQDSLARALHALNASAYIAEPGASASFYGNISSSRWGLSERPLLLIVTPDSSSGEVKAKVSVLTPKFETTRAKMLPIPFPGVEFSEWAEEANPYEKLTISSTSGTIYVDGSVRHFIVDGLQKAFPSAKVVVAPTEIRQLRERKSKAELELMKCANEATLLSIREVRKRMYVGIRESEARAMVAAALKSAGLRDGECLTLFGENAALPHGSGTDRALSTKDFALFDCTASLHGYFSDVTRTIALDNSEIPREHRTIWQSVRGAQNVAYGTAKEGVLAKRVDHSARLFLGLTGYDQYFTHRLGHGIGLEVHEDPYLNGGSETVLKTGHSFSDEPGIYIEGKVGVRLEDCFYIADNGTAAYLTAGVGGAARSPWDP